MNMLFGSAYSEVQENGEISGEEAVKLLRKGVELRKMKIAGNLELRGETFTQPVIVEECHIAGDLLSDYEDATSRPTTFEKAVSFKSTIIIGETRFHAAQFIEEADFDKTQFSGYTAFNRANFRKTVRFEAKFSGPYAHFLDTKFRSYAHFSNAIFSGYAQFQNAEFSRDAYFYKSQFFMNATFQETLFSERAHFENTHFSQHAAFDRAKFSGGAVFSETQFLEAATFGSTNFGSASFFKVQFSRGAFFSNATFKETVNFSASHFEEVLDLYNANFQDNLKLVDCKISLVTFHGVAINKELVSLNLSQVEDKVVQRVDKGKGKQCVKICKFKHNIRESPFQMPCSSPMYYCKETSGVTKQYLFLSNLFKTKGQFDDADKAYYKYRTLERTLMMSQWSKFVSWLIDLICGYGTKPWNAIITGVVIMVAFTVVYMFPHAISSDHKNEAQMNGSWLRRFMHRGWSALYFSVNTFTTVGTGDYYPNGKYRFVSMVEGCLGYLIMALFLVTMTAQMLR